MESSAFERSTEQDDSDPFGQDGMGDFRQDDPLAEAEPPIVDKEGNPVESGGTSDATTQVASGETIVPPEGQIPGQTDLEETLAETTADGSPAEAQGAGEDPQSAPTAGGETASSVASTENETSGGEADPTQPTSSGSGKPASSGSDEGSQQGEEPKKGKRGEPRDYIVLTATGPGAWEQVTWFEDKKGNIVTAGTSGAKKQSIAKVRSLGEALRIGFVALGSPKDGVTLVAVAANFWQPKQVAPKPVVPTRTRLDIT